MLILLVKCVNDIVLRLRLLIGNTGYIYVCVCACVCVCVCVCAAE